MRAILLLRSWRGGTCALVAVITAVILIALACISAGASQGRSQLAVHNFSFERSASHVLPDQVKDPLYVKWVNNWRRTGRLERRHFHLARPTLEVWSRFTPQQRRKVVRLAKRGMRLTTEVRTLTRRAGTTPKFYYSLSNLEQRAIGLGAGVAPQDWVNSGDSLAVSGCESGGDPRRVGSGGAFNGKFQFTIDTWSGLGAWARLFIDPRASGGRWLKAPEWAQNYGAYRLWMNSGSTFSKHWPTCGQGH